MTCQHCGTKFVRTSNRQRYCSASCRRKVSRRTVSHLARPCDVCGQHYTPRRADQRYCDRTCNLRAYHVRRMADPVRRAAMRDVPSKINPKPRNVVRDCEACGEPKRGPRPYHLACRPQRVRSCRVVWSICKKCGAERPGRKPVRYCDTCRPEMLAPGELRIAWEAQDWPTVLRLMIDRSESTGHGCRIWLGQHRDGYAQVRIGRRRLQAYRVIAAAVASRPLATQEPVHHICGDGMCVAPEHLQIVTPHENTAEMLNRRWYVTRIAELEAALRSLDPDHPLLDQLPLAG